MAKNEGNDGLAETMPVSDHEKALEKLTTKYEKQLEALKSENAKLSDTYNSVNTDLSKRTKEMEKLAEELSNLKKSSESLTTKVKQYETWESQYVKARAESLPEDLRDLLPESLSGIEKIQFMDKLQNKLGNKSKVDVGAVGGGTKPPEPSGIDWQRAAKDGKYYAEMRNKMRDPEVWKKILNSSSGE